MERRAGQPRVERLLGDRAGPRVASSVATRRVVHPAQFSGWRGGLLERCRDRAGAALVADTVGACWQNPPGRSAYLAENRRPPLLRRSERLEQKKGRALAAHVLTVPEPG